VSQAAPVEGYALYERVARDVGGNIAFTWIAVAVLWVVNAFWILGAKVLFWVGAAMAALTLIQVAGLTVASTVLAIKGHRESGWTWAANAARVVEVVSDLAALWVAARIAGFLH